MTDFHKKGMINTVLATGKNVAIDDTHGYVGKNECSDGSGGTYAVTSAPEAVIPPIEKGKVLDVQKISATAEVTQIGVIGINPETIVAGEPYRIFESFVGKTKESDSRGNENIFTAVAPAALTGDADTDRLNIYTELASKINNYGKSNLTAKLLTKVEVTAAGNLDEVTVGTKVFQTDDDEDAATFAGYVAYVPDSWSGSVELYLYDVTGTLNDSTDNSLQVGDYVSGDGSTLEDISTDVEAVATSGQGLILIDKSGYFWNPSTISRGGASVLWTSGFVDDEIVIVRDAVYAQGIGSVIAKFLPQYSLDKRNALTGDHELVFLGDDLDTSKNYDVILVKVAPSVDVEGISQMTKNMEVVYELYVDNSTGANVTALVTALEQLK